MAYDGKLLARARLRLEERRADNQAEHQRRLLTVYDRAPEIEEMDAQLRSQMAELVRLTVSHRGEDLRSQIERLKEENLDLQARRAEALVSHGWPVEYLDDVYSCPKCRDTGVRNGAPCDCLVKLYNQELTKELGVLLQTGDESFERFDLSLYSDAPDPATGAVPRQQMEKVYNICHRFAESFPESDPAHLLLQGGTGLGKTYLSACIARVVAEKGYSVCYDSAFAALEAFERQKFARDPGEQEAAAAKVRRILDCDLMILDDLGTEMVTPMSLSALYTLLNTRLVNRRHTIISTNCPPAELEKKYTPQIVSRLTGEFTRVRFIGRDIRLLRRGR